MSTLSQWQNLSKKPFGKQVFSKALCFKAPYFGSIKPCFIELKPGYSEVAISKRRAVLNHIGTVHAIAMCNMAELAGGMMTEVTVPPSHRWIPKGMTVEYLKKANTDLTAIATPESSAEFSTAQDYKVNVAVNDKAGDIVFKAVITMWVSPKS